MFFECIISPLAKNSCELFKIKKKKTKKKKNRNQCTEDNGGVIQQAGLSYCRKPSFTEGNKSPDGFDIHLVRIFNKRIFHLKEKYCLEMQDCHQVSGATFLLSGKYGRIKLPLWRLYRELCRLCVLPWNPCSSRWISPFEVGEIRQ